MTANQNRAEYQRARRAAQAASRPDHRCQECGATFTPKRADARFCSAACRAHRWRPIAHEVADYRESGWPRQPHEHGHPAPHTCSTLVAENTPCGQLATWRLVRSHNRHRHLAGFAYYCAAHVEAEKLPDAVPGDGGNPLPTLARVAAAAGRADRARHGTPAE